MRKKLSLYSVAIFFAVIIISLMFTGKVEAATYSKDAFEINIPNTYIAATNNTTVIKSQSANGRNLIMAEVASENTQGVLNGDKFLQIMKDSVSNTYSGANITSAKNIEKEASICADIKFNRIFSGTTYYYELYAIKSDNYLYVIQFISMDSSFLTSSEKTNMWNSFKIKDTVKVSYGLPFTDVTSKAWYRSAVEYVYGNSIINGINKYTFEPNKKLTRAMMATILYNMEKNPKVSGTSPFKDVKDSSKWYYKAVLWAAKNKVVSGYSNGNFGPNDNITREQLAIMLYNYAKYKRKNVSKLGNITTFSDYKNVASYSQKAVKWAVGNGVITGSKGKLNPKGNATRAEAASMIYKYCLKIGR